MFGIFRRAMTKALKSSQPRKMIAAALAVQKVAIKALQPARKKRVVASKPNSAAKPRARLGETVRRINAGGMPAKGVAPAVKPAIPRGASFKTGHYADPIGKRSYKLYRPARALGPDAMLPLIVMLHGCTQTPDDFAVGTAMNLLADELGFLVAYPAQPMGANAKKCWNWFQPSDQSRGGGEPALIAGITRQIIRDHPVDRARVYIAGLSAGGAAAAIIASAYPDIFAAAGVHSGLPIGAAQNAVAALMVMQAGSLGVRQSVAMPTIVFHGDADVTVHPGNGHAVAARAASTFPDLKQAVKNGKTGPHRYTRTVYRARDRKSYCEHWVIAGGGHAWSGGNPAGSFTNAHGPNASREMLRFFLQHSVPADAAARPAP